MAITYATNAEVRLSYPDIDTVLPVTLLNGAQDGSGTPLTVLTVDSTIGFPFAGSVRLFDSSDVVTDVAYTSKDRTRFILTASNTSVFTDNENVSASEAMLDHYRSLAKGVVDAKLTNPNIPNDLKKGLEIMWVFYLSTRQHCSPETRAWGREALQEFNSSLQDILETNPGKIRQTIALLVEDELTETEINKLKNGNVL